MYKSSKIRMLCFVVGSLSFLFAQPAFAQLAPANDKGVTMGHIHLIVRDPESYKKLLIDTIGVEVAYAGKLELLKLPGIIILLTKGTLVETGAPTADHFALLVQDLAFVRQKLASVDIKVSDDSIAMFPDGVRVEFLEDRNLKVPVAFHHFHIFSANQEIPNWYSDNFGIKFPAAAGFPGGEMRFTTQSDPPRVPSKGHALDHISFEVKGLPEFCKNLEARGIKLDMGIIDAPQIGLRVTFVTDPVGTRIELTEGLAGR